MIWNFAGLATIKLVSNQVKIMDGLDIRDIIPNNLDCHLQS